MPWPMSEPLIALPILRSSFRSKIELAAHFSAPIGGEVVVAWASVTGAGVGLISGLFTVVTVGPRTGPTSRTSIRKAVAFRYRLGLCNLNARPPRTPRLGQTPQTSTAAALPRPLN